MTYKTSYIIKYDTKWHMTGKSINKLFWVINAMIYLFGVTKHLKYVMSKYVMSTL